MRSESWHEKKTWQSRYEVLLLDSVAPTTYSSDSGDRIIVVVQKARTFNEGLLGSGSAAGVTAQNRVKRGDLKHAVIVRTRKKVQRKDGMVVRFDDNACALIGKNGEPLGTRINGESTKLIFNLSSHVMILHAENLESRG